MQVRDIVNFLENKAHPTLQENYDNSGLICGGLEENISKALISLDCTESVVEEAIQKGAQMIISHHPIVFKGLKSLTGKNYVERTVIKAIKNNIALYAIHTNLDNVVHGVNKKLADKLELKNLKILAPKSEQLLKLVSFIPIDKKEEVLEALFKAGAGHIGNYSGCSFSSEGEGSFKAEDGANPHVGQIGKTHFEKEARVEVLLPAYKKTAVLKALFTAHPYEEVAYFLHKLENENQNIGSGMVGEYDKALSFSDFIEHVKNKLGLNYVKHTDDIGKPIKKIALCGGSGSFLLGKAKASGAQAYISSDFKYHEFFDAENEIVITDIGHYESERFTIDLLHDWLSEKFPNFALLKTDINTNPVNIS